ncbi:MAG: SDR family oxidoreductase [Chloroflexota bacterium]
MILIAGGTGRLGTQVVRLLTERGLNVRVLARNAEQAERIRQPLVEVVSGDVRDLDDVKRATNGVQTVISTITGFAGTNGNNLQTVDGQGNSNLIAAAKSNGVEHFILVSVQGAAADHPMELFRMKYRAEQELKVSGVAWTIIRPTAYMETWAMLIGEPLLKTGSTRIFGRGDNPVNFVSAHDVARLVDMAATDTGLRGVTVEIGGPQNLTMNEVARVFEKASGKTGKMNHVPLPMMRVMSVLMRPVNPTLARQIQAAVIMDTKNMSFDPSEMQRRYPSLSLTTLSEMVKREYA